MSWDDSIQVAVSQRVVIDGAHRERRDGLAHDWVDAFRRLHVVPSLIPNDLELVSEMLPHEQIQAVLLTGGNDIVRPGCVVDEDAAPERDETERYLIDFAREARIPVVGICRGAQMLNLHLGGALREDALPRVHVGRSHGLRVDPPHDSAPFEVNSFHRWIITEADLANEFVAVGRAIDDGSVELFRHRSENLTGILWHPERTGPPSMPADDFLRGLLAGQALDECLAKSLEPNSAVRS